MPKAKKTKIKEALETGVIHEKAEEKVEKATESAETKKVRIQKVVCRPEGTFLPNRIYEIDSSLADKLIASGNAKEEQ